MDHEENEPNVLKATSQWSKVSEKRKKHRYLFILFICFLIALCIFFLSSLKFTPIQKLEKKQTNNDYRVSLNENLARLKAMQIEKMENKVKKLRLNDDIQLLRSNTFLSKEVLARQNAPTRMYSHPSLENNREEKLNSSRYETGETNKINVVEVQTIAHPEFTIASGEFLQAILETAINSDLPGKIRAVVSRPVYAYTGRRRLIPSGSRLIGHYLSSVIQGQNRIMVIWDCIILPGGMTVQFNSPSIDSLGRGGLGADSVNRHFFARFSESALLSVIGAGTATAGVSNQDQYNSATQYRTVMAQSFQQSAQQSLQGTQAIKPTLYIHQGTAINVFVTQDLSFYQVLKNKGLEGVP